MVLLISSGSLAKAGGETSASMKWESEVLEHEGSDRERPPRKGGILFTGSSSIRRWETLEKDFPGLPVLARGIGGSQMHELNEYIDRLVIPHAPVHVLVYEGDNDIASGRTPRHVADGFKFFVREVRRKLPSTRITYISIKPSKARWKHVDTIRETNQRIRRYAFWAPGVGFADIFTPMLGTDGLPRQELFTSDDLHVNEAGYREWAKVIRPLLRTHKASGSP